MEIEDVATPAYVHESVSIDAAWITTKRHFVSSYINERPELAARRSKLLSITSHGHMLAINYPPRKPLTTQAARSILTVEPFKPGAGHERNEVIIARRRC